VACNGCGFPLDGSDGLEGLDGSVGRLWTVGLDRSLSFGPACVRKAHEIELQLSE